MEYKGLYISIAPDCGPNEGGYYCQVYEDRDMRDQIDEFCIHPDELAENADVEHWIKANVDGMTAAEGPNMEMQQEVFP